MNGGETSMKSTQNNMYPKLSCKTFCKLIYKELVDFFRKNRVFIPNRKLHELYNQNEEPWMFVIKVILSAQSKDKTVNQVAKVLFQKYPTLEKLANAKIEDVERIIKPIPFYRKKAVMIINAAKILYNEFNGNIPHTYEDLYKLPGVSRKSAATIRAIIHEIPSIIVDRHVIRVLNRLRFVNNVEDPIYVESRIEKCCPKEIWIPLCLLLILFGRYICTARNPQCHRCPLQKYCFYSLSNRK